MEGVASQSGSGMVGFITQGDIRTKHDAIMRISEVVLDEIQRDQLAITDTLQKAARASARVEDHLHRTRAPNSLGNTLNDSTSGLGSEFVADGHFTDEGSEIPTYVVQGLKPPCKYHEAIFDRNVYPSQEASTHTTGSKPNARPASIGNIRMTSNCATSSKQDPNKTKAKTAEWDEPLLKNASFVLDLLPTTLKKSLHEQPTVPREMPMCDFTKGFSAFSSFLSNEIQSSGLGESPIVSGEIPDDTMSAMVQSNQDETAISKQDPLYLLDLVPDVPRDIMNICWKYQDLDDGQLENMRHYMIAKAFGWRGKVHEESVL